MVQAANLAHSLPTLPAVEPCKGSKQGKAKTKPRKQNIFFLMSHQAAGLTKLQMALAPEFLLRAPNFF